jgi:hypothetical protein
MRPVGCNRRSGNRSCKVPVKRWFVCALHIMCHSGKRLLQVCAFALLKAITIKNYLL